MQLIIGKNESFLSAMRVTGSEIVNLGITVVLSSGLVKNIKKYNLLILWGRVASLKCEKISSRIYLHISCKALLKY